MTQAQIVHLKLATQKINMARNTTLYTSVIGKHDTVTACCIS